MLVFEIHFKQNKETALQESREKIQETMSSQKQNERKEKQRFGSEAEWCSNVSQKGTLNAYSVYVQLSNIVLVKLDYDLICFSE